jgi:hypothetical protein
VRERYHNPPDSLYIGRASMVYCFANDALLQRILQWEQSRTYVLYADLC